MGSMNEEESPALEQRVAKVEGILEEVRARLNHMESEIRDVRAEISELRREIHINFRWMVGIMLIIWVTIILAIIFAP